MLMNGYCIGLQEHLLYSGRSYHAGCRAGQRKPDGRERGRFSGVGYPGETIVTDCWQESSTRVLVQARSKERGEALISNAATTIA